jgi:hypothetical protein
MDIKERNQNQEHIRGQLKAVEEQYERLREENVRLRAMLGIPDSGTGAALRATVVPEGTTKVTPTAYTPEEKIDHQLANTAADEDPSKHRSKAGSPQRNFTRMTASRDALALRRSLRQSRTPANRSCAQDAPRNFLRR